MSFRPRMKPSPEMEALSNWMVRTERTLGECFLVCCQDWVVDLVNVVEGKTVKLRKSGH